VTGRGRTTQLVAGGLVAVGLLLAGAHLSDVHSSYGLWSWAPSSPTPRIPFDGRRYERSGTPGALRAGFGRVGLTWDGLGLFGPNTNVGTVPTEIAVRLPSGRYAYYRLLGRP
jgi:hypothetical protein